MNLGQGRRRIRPSQPPSNSSNPLLGRDGSYAWCWGCDGMLGLGKIVGKIEGMMALRSTGSSWYPTDLYWFH